ncbi:aminopeptidase N [Sphingomonas sp. ID1715]|uniref:aminopeptidase N n=1 Tax=Sphingomonas sp. ID1715 TaxID=1656898 RepID=UPI00148960E3|nr:aminopeptidase N [Sphingomonas sp. ID1715]NNM76031.1 aminopeptidase N [Sphingomonas sp. ID1715]
MADVQNSAAPQVIRREDYRPPDWRVAEIALEFELDPAQTIVRSRLQVERAGEGPLRLDHGGQELLSFRTDGAAAAYREEGGQYVVDLPGEAHLIETECVLAPDKNTELMGLYASGGLLCTQCEAEGFRRITPFPDRPDVLARYRVRMVADKARFPVLLSNGDLAGSGDLPDGRHWAEWHDPFLKPSYLFALVAGDLQANRDSFTTMSSRKVDLGIWVRQADLPKTAHAMQALKDAMAWDERVYGREYDLDVFNIVAVADFNFGAMENKGLNIFNSRYILADPETATDADFDAVAAVVAHEYFHNWSGNRITCRDWFQLSLKEGFTVFRDQQFSADHGSAAVKRIEDVRVLRAAQFPEDAGPLAHPVRPDSFIEISNFYTATIYNKGAELIRMMHTLAGPERFRRGTDLYFDRFDGQAVTCDDFVAAMEEGAGLDLSRFRRWYEQAGTPKVKASVRISGGETVVALEQQVPPTPGQPHKQPMPLPLRLALFGAESGTRLVEEQLVVLDDASTELRFAGLAEPPVLSINRGFSAPVVVESDRTAANLALLSAHDDDPFARYEALQQLMLGGLIAAIEGAPFDDDAVIEAVRRTLTNPALDKAFIGEAVLPPSEAFIGDQMVMVDPEAIHAARESLRQRLGRALETDWREAYLGSAANRFELTPAAKGARRLRSVALGFLMAGGAQDAPMLAWEQFQGASNMTDRQGALNALASSETAEREKALAAFYDLYRGDPLVLDKWFTTQALASRAGVLDDVLRLSRHPDFTLTNPNRARALVGAFSANQHGFHSGGVRSYQFLADTVLELDKLNPQTAARFVVPLGRWRRFAPERGAQMRAELERIVASPQLSKDVFEQASKSLA